MSASRELIPVVVSMGVVQHCLNICRKGHFAAVSLEGGGKEESIVNVT